MRKWFQEDENNIKQTFLVLIIYNYTSEPNLAQYSPYIPLKAKVFLMFSWINIYIYIYIYINGTLPRTG